VAKRTVQIQHALAVSATGLRRPTQQLQLLGARSQRHGDRLQLRPLCPHLLPLLGAGHQGRPVQLFTLPLIQQGTPTEQLAQKQSTQQGPTAARRQ